MRCIDPIIAFTKFVRKFVLQVMARNDHAESVHKREGNDMPEISIVNPESMGRPLSLYGQIARVRASEFVFISGQLATDLDGRIVGKGDFDAQMKQVLSNIEKGLKSVEASFANVVQFTTYLVHSQDIACFRRVREELFPTMFPTHRYPPNTLFVVDRLVQEDFLIEIETIAAL